MTNQTAPASRNTWLWLGLLLAIAVALAVWLMPRSTTGTSDMVSSTEAEEPAIAAAPPTPREEPPAPKAEPKPETPAVAAAPTPAPAAKASDMFAEPMPDFMVDLHAKVLDKKWLSARQQKQLYEYGQQNKNDARPQLILAWDAKNREWDGIAADMYRIAYRADKRAKDDPNMLNDLLYVIGAHQHETVEFKDSAELITDAYGAEALPKIEQELAAAQKRGEQVRSERLNRLRDQIRSH